MHIVKIFPVAFVCVTVLLLSTAWAGGTPASLELLLGEADRNNPELQAAMAQAEMVGNTVDQALSLDDPMLGFGIVNIPLDQLDAESTPMSGATLTLSQQFPFPGKLAAKGDMAREKTRWYQKAFEDSRLRLRRQVKDAWYRLLYHRQAIELTKQNIALLDDFIRLTETRYKVGKGLQQNVLKAQLERSKLLDSLLTLEQQEETTLAELNRLVGRETFSPLAQQPIPELSRTEYTLTELQAQAQQKRPLYDAYRSLIAKFEAQSRLAAIDYKPDFNLWAGYRLRDDDLADGGSDFFSTGITINLPVRLSRRRAAVAEADSGERMAHKRYNDFRLQVDLSIHQALARMRESAKLTDLYKTGIIPQADQTFQSTLAAYQVNKIDFLDLLDSLLTLYRYEIDYYRALTDHERSLAQLIFAAGLEAEVLKPVSSQPK